MLRVVESFEESSFLGRLGRIALAILVFTLASSAQLRAQVVATYNFDDGTADGWTSFNGASTPVASNAAAYTGSYSLLTTTGSGGAGGPSISLNGVLQAGAKYTITGYVMLTSGESASNANFTIKRSDPSCSGGTCYDTIGTYQVPVSDSGWAQIGGTYTVSTTETALTLYAQLVGATTAQSFYLDDVVITETAPPPGEHRSRSTRSRMAPPMDGLPSARQPCLLLRRPLRIPMETRSACLSPTAPPVTWGRASIYLA